MSDDARIHQRLLDQARAYARLYPSILPRLKAALAAGDPAMKSLVEALSAAMERGDLQREHQLRDHWRLSPKEILVTLHLIDGGMVTSCAAMLGVAESTIRTHLKSVFAKTGRNRQSQLASLLQNSGVAPNSTDRMR